MNYIRNNVQKRTRVSMEWVEGRLAFIVDSQKDDPGETEKKDETI
jgi:hypothetical protein